MSINIIIIGGGGHARVLVDTIEFLRDVYVLGYTDVEEKKHQKLNYLGCDEVIRQYSVKEVFLVNGIGSVSLPMERKEVYEKFKQMGYSFYSVIHPKAIISTNVALSEGVQVMAGAVINVGTMVGENTIINTSASIDHDCKIGSHCHIAPGVTLSGNVIIGSSCHVGTGATIIQNITIGASSLIGAGAVVIRNISHNVKAYGNPAGICS